MLKLPDGTIKVLVEGVKRVKIVEFTEKEDMFAASVEQVDETETESEE